tara:strand:- start:188 stop:985 length:798 start_codon:yes stop_codon:yes gene_type:complete
MSLHTLKKKSVAKLNLSGRSPEQTWMVQGPYGKLTPSFVKASGGFSLNGGYRNVGAVGPTNLGKSVTRTPFRGPEPMGHGTCCGTYKREIHSSGSCCTNNNNYIKPSVLSTKGMLDKKYRWFTSNMSSNKGWVVKPGDNYPLNSSQGLYIEQVRTEAALHKTSDISGNGLPYAAKRGGCSNRTLNFTGTKRIPCASYTKTVPVTITSGENIPYRQRNCLAQTGAQTNVYLANGSYFTEKLSLNSENKPNPCSDPPAPAVFNGCQK